MTEFEVIQKLQQEAKANKTAMDMFYAFAMRKRTTTSITIPALLQKMKAMGFNHSREEYSQVLKLLADLGLGAVDYNANHKVKRLKNIKVTLQSVGAAALGENGGLSNTKARNRFIKLVKEHVPEDKVHPLPKQASVDTYIGLTVRIDGKSFNINMPEDVTVSEISKLISIFKSKTA